MPDLYDVAAIGNAIVDVIAPADDAFLAAHSLDKGAMMLVDAERSAMLYGQMAKGVETSGGSAVTGIYTNLGIGRKAHGSFSSFNKSGTVGGRNDGSRWMQRSSFTKITRSKCSWVH